MLWYLLCAALTLLPLFIVTVVYTAARLGSRSDPSHRGDRLEPPVELSTRPRPGTTLRPSTAALEAQYLLVPARAVREAEDHLRTLGTSVASVPAESTPDALRQRFEHLLLKIEQLEDVPVPATRARPQH
jgi:hypothetical protein